MHSSALVGLLAFASAVSAFPPIPPKPVVKPHTTPSIINLKEKIKNVVVLVMENRSVDNLLGGQKIRGLENPINNGPFCNPYNVTDPTQGQYCTAPKDYDSVLYDPDHGLAGNNMEYFSDWVPDNNAIANGSLVPGMKGFAAAQIHLYPAVTNFTFIAAEAMNYYTEDQVPVITALVQNYLVFNHWHSDYPGPTYPNRAFITSGSCYGYGDNAGTAYFDHGLPQRSIFQQMSETNHTWLNYWDPAGGTGPDANYYNWTYITDNTDKVVPLANFYTDAAAGKLPEFSYINPSCCSPGSNSMHPNGLVSDGEKLIKAIYESVRASPQWNETLFIITFDESGGFHDHVSPPLATPPDNITYSAPLPIPPWHQLFSMNRLGGRIPTFLISPWISKGVVEQKGVNSNGTVGSYHATSLLRTLGYLWDFEPFNPRIESAPSFDHLINPFYRFDTPALLPNASAFGNEMTFINKTTLVE